MTQAFIFGKFLPFHRGHEAMIRFALQHCNRLTVLVCVEEKEPIPGELRCAWIRETFSEDPRVHVRSYAYHEGELSARSETSDAASKAWAAVFEKELPGHQLLVTSEPYGPLVAQYMGICHLSFDPQRVQVPVAASLLRKDPLRYWQHLPESVRPYYVRKVVLLGTESTGKSTLAALLAQHFNATLVTEAARAIIADSTDITIDDLYRVADAHASSIARSARGDRGLLIIDTDIHITRSYARHFFGTDLEVDDVVVQANRADLYLYLEKDVPYVQDSTRLPREERDALDASHRAVLADAGIRFVVIRGSWDKRFASAVQAVETLLRTA